MKEADRIREFAASNFIAPARRRGEKTVQITAGDIRSGLHLGNVVANVVQALKGPKFLRSNHLEIESIEGPPSGVGPNVKITYRLLDEDGQVSGSSEDLFLRLYGIGKEVFASLGGGEAFIRREREQFYGDREAP